MWHAWAIRGNTHRILVDNTEENHLENLGIKRMKIEFVDMGWDGIEWIFLPQDRGKWRNLVKTLLKLRV